MTTAVITSLPSFTSLASLTLTLVARLEFTPSRVADLELSLDGVIDLVEEGVHRARAIFLDMAEDLGLEASMILEHEGQRVFRSELEQERLVDVDGLEVADAYHGMREPKAFEARQAARGVLALLEVGLPRLEELITFMARELDANPGRDEVLDAAISEETRVGRRIPLLSFGVQ